MGYFIFMFRSEASLYLTCSFFNATLVVIRNSLTSNDPDDLIFDIEYVDFAPRNESDSISKKDFHNLKLLSLNVDTLNASELNKSAKDRNKFHTKLNSFLKLRHSIINLQDVRMCDHIADFENELKLTSIMGKRHVVLFEYKKIN